LRNEVVTIMQSHRRQDALKGLHANLVDLVAIMNMPQLDKHLLAEAGVELDQALFPLLIAVERYGPIGVVDLAGRAGRDYSTVSRQVARLAELGLVTRQPNPRDRRVIESAVTSQGERIVAALDAARQRLNAPVFAQWSDRDLFDLVRLLRRYVDELTSRVSFEDGETVT
jgi:DNA-binding MarR family transcriptional regulator